MQGDEIEYHNYTEKNTKTITLLFISINFVDIQPHFSLNMLTQVR